LPGVLGDGRLVVRLRRAGVHHRLGDHEPRDPALPRADRDRGRVARGAEAAGGGGSRRLKRRLPESARRAHMPANRPLPPLSIRAVETFAVEVPMTFALGTSAATVRRAPLLLVNLETAEGITGRSYLFCYRRSVPRAIDALLRDAVSL